jgi:MFS transporter, DHA3 family, multidrug efflux protein
MSLRTSDTLAAVDEQPADDWSDERAFHRLLLNTLLSGVTSSFLWFALTFWVYLETRSVVATGIVGGAFGLAGAAIGPVFGTYVDRHRKHRAMVLVTSASLGCFAVAAALYVLVDSRSLLELGRPWFWLLVAATLVGSVAGNIRSIALSTCVTLLVPEERRDRANGMVGTVTGISFAITSVFSGLVIGTLGMGWALAISVTTTALAVVHLVSIRFAEPEPDPATTTGSRVDIKGALEAIRAVRGLRMLIALAAFNNLLAGVFMALVDPYGLELVSVQVWGLLWMFISAAMIVGGLGVAKFGLGRSPLRLILLGNLVNWIVCSVFAIRSSIVLLTIGMVVWLALVPVIEAAEQTVLQRVIPFERQGRVFGFAQLVENAASPITAFLIGPLAQTVVMPFMTDGTGAEVIGSWFGTGPVRGMALLFCAAGLVGVVVTALAWSSRSYRELAVDEATAREAADATGSGSTSSGATGSEATGSEATGSGARPAS